jgi:hypothetical protein
VGRVGDFNQIVVNPYPGWISLEGEHHKILQAWSTGEISSGPDGADGEEVVGLHHQVVRAPTIHGDQVGQVRWRSRSGAVQDRSLYGFHQPGLAGTGACGGAFEIRNIIFSGATTGRCHGRTTSTSSSGLGVLGMPPPV